MVKNIKNDLVEFEYDGGTLVRFFKRYRYVSSYDMGGFVGVLDRPVMYKPVRLERFMV